MIVRHLTPAFSFPDTRLSVTKCVQIGARTFFHHTSAQRPLMGCSEGWPLTPMVIFPTSRVIDSSVSVCAKTASSLRLRQLENAALFLPLGLPSTLICHKNRAFFHRKNLKTPGFRFQVNVKHFGNRVSRKQWRRRQALTEFSNTNSKWSVVATLNLKSFGMEWTKNIWRVFKASKLNLRFRHWFLRRRVEEAFDITPLTLLHLQLIFTLVYFLLVFSTNKTFLKWLPCFRLIWKIIVAKP